MYSSQRAISKKKKNNNNDEIMNENEKLKGDEYIVSPCLRKRVEKF